MLNKYTIYFTHTCAVFPNNCSLSLVAMGDKYEREERIDFWDDVQGQLFVHMLVDQPLL